MCFLVLRKIFKKSRMPPPLTNKQATRKSKIPRYPAPFTKRKFNNFTKVFESNDNLTPPNVVVLIFRLADWLLRFRLATFFTAQEM